MSQKKLIMTMNKLLQTPPLWSHPDSVNKCNYAIINFLAKEVNSNLVNSPSIDYNWLIVKMDQMIWFWQISPKMELVYTVIIAKSS